MSIHTYTDYIKMIIILKKKQQQNYVISLLDKFFTIF